MKCWGTGQQSHITHLERAIIPSLLCSSGAGLGSQAGPDGLGTHAAQEGAGIYPPAAQLQPRALHLAAG